MNPYRLDLTTFEWVRESGLVSDPRQWHPQELPRPRQRTAAERVGSQWLLLVGGSPTQVTTALKIAKSMAQMLLHTVDSHGTPTLTTKP